MVGSRLLRWSVVFLLIVLLSPACSSDKEEGTPRGGKVTFGFRDPPDLDPWTSVDPFSTPFLSILHEGLVRLDSAGVLQPGVAESWNVSADSSTYTFKIRTDARFDDGSPISAFEFERAFHQTFRSDGPKHGRPRYWSVQGAHHPGWRKRVQLGVEAVDSLTFVIQLHTPDRWLLNKLAMPRYAVPHASDEKIEELGRIPSSGPYSVADASPKKTILVRNPYYWSTGERSGWLDTVVIRTGLPHRRAVQSISSGAIDVLWPAPLAYRQRLDRDQSTAYLESPAASEVSWYLVLNSAILPTGRKPVRQAIASALNRQSLLDRFGQSLQILRNPTWGDTTDAILAVDFEPSRSQEFLRLADHPRGLRVAITVPRESQEEEIANALLQDMGISGFHVEINSVSRSQYWKRLQQRHGAVASVIAWRPGLGDPIQVLADAYLNSSLDQSWGWTLGYYRSAGAFVDTLLLRGLRSPDPDLRQAYVEKVSARLAADLPLLPLARAPDGLYHRPRIQGLYFHPSYRLDLTSVWVSDSP